MKLMIVGSGHVDLASDGCPAGPGHEVVCVDRGVAKIDRLRPCIVPIFGLGLDAPAVVRSRPAWPCRKPISRLLSSRIDA